MRTRTNSIYTYEDIEALLKKPHYIGHLAGKDKLIDVHSDWIHYMWSSHHRERSLQAFRGSYKTTSVLVIGVPFWLLTHPDDRIFIIRKKFTDASEIVETIASIIEIPEIAELFKFFYGEYPKYVVKRKEKIVYNFKKTRTPEGNINAFGLDTSLVGKHGDVIFLDDFVTLKDRVSRAERNRTTYLIREIATNIVDPNKKVRYLGTPWHKEDAWSICPKPVKYDVNSLDLLSEEEIEHKRKKTTTSLYAANYLLEHVADDDALFKDPVWGKWEYTGVKLPRAHLDAAFDGEHYCALTIMAQRDDGRIQAVGFTYNGNVKDWITQIVNIMRRYKCKKIYNEDNADKGYTADLLKKEGLSVHVYNERMNKHIKISSYLFETWSDIVWSEETDPEYMNQILDYSEKQEPDDAPDSASSLIMNCFSKKGRINTERWKW